MIVNVLRHAGWLALVASASVAACSKQTPTETAFVAVQLQGKGENAILCTIGNQPDFFDVGSEVNAQAPAPIPEGENGLNVDCTVSPDGSGYDLKLNAGFPGPETSLVITGQKIDPMTGGTVAATFVNPTEGGAFSESDCTLTYTYLNSAIPADQQISGGNIWAHVSCPNAAVTGGMFSGQQVVGPDGGVATLQCDAEVDFQFAGCAQ